LKKKNKYYFEYTKHAIEQQKIRKIKRKAIEETLLNPEQIVQSKENKTIAQRMINIGGNNFLLRVIYIKSNTVSKIITVYLTTQIKKYVGE
jgi:hypothetical protein